MHAVGAMLACIACMPKKSNSSTKGVELRM
jgi:hypothetical protein